MDSDRGFNDDNNLDLLQTASKQNPYLPATAARLKSQPNSIPGADGADATFQIST
jgi:hypothetical protein